MDKKKTAILISAVVILIVGVLITMWFFKKKNNAEAIAPDSSGVSLQPVISISDETPIEVLISDGDLSQGNTGDDYRQGGVFCLAETRERALEIADMYGIELYSWQDEVAVFNVPADMTAEELIQMGYEKGYPGLSINSIETIEME